MIALQPGLHSAITINEIRIDQPGRDVDEYFELYSTTPGASLNDLTYLVIGDGTGGSGVIEAVIDLNGASFGTDNQYFLATEQSFTLATAPDLSRTETSLNFENSDNVTHLLVQGFTGSNGDDLDTNDDGTLNHQPWIRVLDAVSLVAMPSSGERFYGGFLGFADIGSDGTFVPGHIYRVNDIGEFAIGRFNTGVTDTPGTSNRLPTAPATSLTIPEIQGSKASSPVAGTNVRTTGIVVGDFQENDELRGFFIQDPIGDGDSSTSDGIFVFESTPTISLTVGDEVEVTGTIVEFNGQTEFSNPSSVTVVGSGTVLPTPVKLPEATNGELERFEGMLVRITSTMTITQNYFLGRYGQLTLAATGDDGTSDRLFQPTSIFPPGTNAQALAADNLRRRLILDDGQAIDRLSGNPLPPTFIGAAPGSVIRSGDRVSNLIGVLDYGRIDSSAPPTRDYRLHPTVTPSLTTSNPRPEEPPTVGGNLKIASFNVLNYFTTLNRRGANSATELDRQTAKIVAALKAMNADIVGLIEVENDSGTTLQTLVHSLNTAIGANTYTMIDTGKIGTDAIKVGLIYKPTIVNPQGTFKILDNTVDSRALDTFNRPALAQTFQHNVTSDDITIVVNHFKSKGSPCDAIGDPNAGDGQGNCNGTRTSLSRAIIDWLATDPTSSNDPDVLIIGDLNAYAKEDPIRILEEASFTDLIRHFNGSEAYSFTFDGQAGYLDHALGSPSVLSKSIDVKIWHINTDEPPLRDYNTEYNPVVYFEANEFRSSDHDPLLIGLQMSPAKAPAVNPDSIDFSRNPRLRIRPEGLNIRITFAGVPETSYMIQFTESLTNPNWIPIGTRRADARGNIDFLHLRPSLTSGFYRTR